MLSAKDWFLVFLLLFAKDKICFATLHFKNVHP